MANPRLPVSRLGHRPRLNPSRRQSSTAAFRPQQPQHDPYALLANPTWSIRSLLPPSAQRPTTTVPKPTATSETPLEAKEVEEPTITATQLTHLLRLSALPQPTHPSQTAHMLQTLHAQLHFVRDIQRVNTDGVEPLSSIRDETAEGLRESAVTTETLRQALAEEETYGRCKRPRRRRQREKDVALDGAGKGVEDWDVLGSAGERVGRYFVVRSGGNGKVTGKEE